MCRLLTLSVASSALPVSRGAPSLRRSWRLGAAMPCWWRRKSRGWRMQAIISM